MIMGGAMLLGSAVLLGIVLIKTWRNPEPETDTQIAYAEPIHPPAMPLWVEDFKIWNLVILGLMLISFGWPIAQFFFLKTFESVPWGY
jgi:cytochrome c oxidase subunit 1